ncbi:transglycosylase SLT domain-containing protein [Paracoccus pacificus]|uniref:Transglycosylase SLT domain-containing protein n=1 Tax=Paracoccus pacificus TaxID=1463598 RepID=A0ABW4R754_9RHOB
MTGLRRWGVVAMIVLLAGCEAETSAIDASSPNPAAAGDAAAMRMAAPVMRWDARRGSDAWTQAALDELRASGVSLVTTVPADINLYCPAYLRADPDQRRAFWAGLVSSVSKFESSHNPAAKGGGGRWLGLMQIAPATARQYGCDGGLLNGEDNVACAVKIMARNVSRDGAIAQGANGGWRGVARDWMPMRNSAKRNDIAAWTRKQSYCSGAGSA